MTNTPNKRNIQLWVDALRSGEYVQGQGRLRGGDGYCCLGVACDVSGLGIWDDGEYRIGHEAAALTLPPIVSDWLGIEAINPLVNGSYLTTHNDRLGESFSEIADLIEREYLSA